MKYKTLWPTKFLSPLPVDVDQKIDNLSIKEMKIELRHVLVHHISWNRLEKFNPFSDLHDLFWLITTFGISVSPIKVEDLWSASYITYNAYTNPKTKTLTKHKSLKIAVVRAFLKAFKYGFITDKNLTREL